MEDTVAVLARLARSLARPLAGQDVSAPMAHRLGSAASAVIGADGAAITLSYTRVGRITLCATTDLAARLEDLQEVLGQGPGALAYERNAPVRVDLGWFSPHTVGPDRSQSGHGLEPIPAGETLAWRVEPAWPDFAHQVASDFGAVSVLAVPIHPAHDVLGVLTFYSNREPPPSLETDVAQFLADAVGVAILHEGTWLLNETSGAWASRSQVHQATGMVIAQLQLPAADALALLRAHAFAGCVSLLEVARAVLRREIDFSRAGHPDDTKARDEAPPGDEVSRGDGAKRPPHEDGRDDPDGSTTS